MSSDISTPNLEDVKRQLSVAQCHKAELESDLTVLKPFEKMKEIKPIVDKILDRIKSYDHTIDTCNHIIGLYIKDIDKHANVKNYGENVYNVWKKYV